MSKDLFSDDSISYSYLAFGLLNPETNEIKVKKFFWPECEFDDYEETRSMTPENENKVLYKRKVCGESCSCQSKGQS